MKYDSSYRLELYDLFKQSRRDDWRTGLHIDKIVYTYASIKK